MDTNYLIHEYLDSGLDEVREQIMFKNIASNSELRTEFSNQLRMQQIAKTDMSLITPPIESTGMIFSTLGFNIPSVIGGGTAALTSSGVGMAIGARLALFFRNYSTAIYTGLISSLVSSLLVYFSISTNHDNANNVAVNKTNSTNTQFSNPKPANTKSSIAIVKSSEASSDNSDASVISKTSIIERKSTLEKEKIKYLTKYIQVSTVNGKSEVREINKNEFNALKDSKPNEVFASTNPVANQESNNLVTNGTQNTNSFTLPTFDSPIDKFNKSYNFKDELINSTRNTIFQNQMLVVDSPFESKENKNEEVDSQREKVKDLRLSISTMANPTYNAPSSFGSNNIQNMRLTGSYLSNSYLTWSVIIATEDFMRKSNDYNRFETGNRFWLGGGLKFYYPLLNNSIQPYAEGIAGFVTQFGPMAKMQFGINFVPESRYGFHIGYEPTWVFGNGFINSTGSNYQKTGFIFGLNYTW